MCPFRLTCQQVAMSWASQLGCNCELQSLYINWCTADHFVISFLGGLCLASLVHLGPCHTPSRGTTFGFGAQ